MPRLRLALFAMQGTTFDGARSGSQEQISTGISPSMCWMSPLPTMPGLSGSGKIDGLFCTFDSPCHYHADSRPHLVYKPGASRGRIRNSARCNVQLTARQTRDSKVQGLAPDPAGGDVDKAKFRDGFYKKNQLHEMNGVFVSDQAAKPNRHEPTWPNERARTTSGPGIATKDDGIVYVPETGSSGLRKDGGRDVSAGHWTP
ncbi:uncharacterized protein P884DRAFT_273098 [Thermothelomyces heterothallicus CBS 202.75]|uniref:uncharacterized protein n=1 Tax=Thermothelomyces heterothallicus CBS 202.75 TaxID=1149848 RepID=UPI0037432C33